MLRRIWREKGKLLTYLWIGVIFILSTTPTVPGEGAVPHFHQIGHFTEFTVLATLLLLFIFPDKKIKAVGVAVTFGIFIEAYQHFLPWRSFELLDLAVDTGGVAFGLLLYKIVLNKANVINY